MNRYSFYLFLILSLLFIVFGCKSSTGSDDNKSSIKIEWITPSDGEVQYGNIRNNVGLKIGLLFEAEFRVAENSGNVTIKITLVDDDSNVEESITLNVAEGENYLVNASSYFVGTTSCVATSVAATVTFSSPSASIDKEKTVLNWIDNNPPFVPYCINLGPLEDISITEIVISEL
jgi:hypothetical protein